MAQKLDDGYLLINPEAESAYDACARCGKPIPKFDGICGDCQLDLLYEQEEFRQRLQEAYEKGEL